MTITNKNLENEINFSDFVNLKFLDCSNNYLTSLNVEDCHKLETLSFRNNPLENINFNFQASFFQSWREKGFNDEITRRYLLFGFEANEADFANYVNKYLKMNREKSNEEFNLDSQRKYYQNLCSDCRNFDCKEKCREALNWCSCECTLGGVNDITKKAVSIGGGVLVAGGGIAMTVASGGTALPIIIGSTLSSAGISTTIYATGRAIQKKAINPNDLLWEIGTGAATGLVTGPIGVGGGSLAVKATHELAEGTIKKGLTELAINVGTGVVSGMAGGTTGSLIKGEEITIKSVLTSAAAGGFGGATSHGGELLVKTGAQNVAEGGIRVAASAIGGGAVDYGIQKFNILSGEQEEIDWKRVATSAGTAAATTAAYEGVKNGVYTYNGGKEQFIDRKRIEEESKGKSESHKDAAKEGLSIVNREENKKVIGELVKKDTERSRIVREHKKIGQEIYKERGSINEIKKSVLNPSEKKIMIQKKLKNIEVLKGKKTELPSVPRKQNIVKIEGKRLHILDREGERFGQLSMNVTTGSSRGKERVVFTFSEENVYFAGSTEQHNYGEISDSSKSLSLHNEKMTQVDANLSQISHTMNSVQTLKYEEEREELENRIESLSPCYD